MRSRHSRAALLAGVTALLFAAALAPAPASAGVTSGAPPRPATITTVLYPGWNMVGWVGEASPVPELFESLPELRLVFVWDAEARQYRWATPAGDGALTTLAPGQGVWLQIGGDAPVEWVRTVSSGTLLLSLHAGHNLVGWAGAESEPLADVAGRFGDAFVRAWLWDAPAQRFAPYREDEGATELGPGDALWLYLRSSARWWQSGAAGTTFMFGEGVTPRRQAEVRREVRNVVAFFAEQYGIEPPQFRLRSFVGDGCGAAHSFLTPAGSTDTRHSGSRVHVPNDIAGPELSGCVAHEYFHVVQAELGAGRSSPAWMREGTAEYAASVYVVATGQATPDAVRSEWARLSVWTASDLGDMEGDSFYRYRVSGGYQLGARGVDWLAAHSAGGGVISPGVGPRFADQARNDAYVRYYRLLPHVASWHQAFEEAFGIGAEAFYAAFDDHLDATGTRAPHLSDDVVRPVAAFVGEVPADTRAAVVDEMNSVYRFLTTRLGAEPFEYTVYVISDDPVELPTHLTAALTRHSLDRDAYLCGLKGEGWIIHRTACTEELGHTDHFSKHVSDLYAGTDHDLNPVWLSSGGLEYAQSVYRAESGLVSYSAEVRRRVGRVQQSPATLRQIADNEGWWDAGNASWALSFLAVDWLAGHAGEPAIFRYARLLPRGEPNRVGYEPGAGSWEAAFEQAFDLTPDEFYRRFEAYRATLP